MRRYVVSAVFLSLMVQRYIDPWNRHLTIGYRVFRHMISV